MQLIIGNKNYSSWSLRPWILMTHFGLNFEEKLIKLFTPTMKQEMEGLCPAYKLPALINDSHTYANQRIQVWDSLAICEFLNDTYLDGKAWPTNINDKTTARAIANEMHSGFFGIRNELPMNLRRTPEQVSYDELSEQAVSDIKRICEIWYNALENKTEQSQLFLFGDFSIADAMYFPVVTRFNTYGIEIPSHQSKAIKSYMKAMLELPALLKWQAAALEETDVVQEDER